MKRTAIYLCVMAMLATLAVAQAAPQQPRPQGPPTPPTVSMVLERPMGGLERNMVSLAEEIPEDKYDYKPSGQPAQQDVRTFASQVKHVAANNFYFAAVLLGENITMTDEERENGPANLKTKADIVKYLKDSFAKAHEAIKTINDKNLLEMQKAGQSQMSRLAASAIFTWHGYDHYGQMVVYARSLNIVPPGSRPRQ